MARPREFDTDKALRAALLVFWNKGYDGASLTDLADAMGIVRPSLHAAFGTKEDLYRKVLELYGKRAMGFSADALGAASAAEVARLYLDGYCVMLSNPDHPPGCLLVKGVVACGNGAAIARQELLSGQNGYEALLEQRFRRAQREGDLAADADVPSLVACLTTMASGLAVRADAGASLAELRRIAATLMSKLL